MNEVTWAEVRPENELSISALRSVSGETTRPTVRGKFLYRGDEKFYVHGVTYGTFRPDENSCQFPSFGRVREDFALMSQNNINAIRTYTVPPVWLLDSAGEHGIAVMVGLPWEQHVAFLDDRHRAKSIIRRVQQGVRDCEKHPAILCYSVGNEIPASIVRWQGPKRIENFLKALYEAVKEEDTDGLVTYVNFPTTEYLNLSFLDLFCFNVYLERRPTFEAYIARLQNLAGDKPLLMAEMGLDSQRNGEAMQASALSWQIRSTFASGCSGAFVFAWTDEWYRGTQDIEDWDFGITRRDRTPKLALQTVRQVYNCIPFSTDVNWPLISVVVCSYNGSRTIKQCLDHLMRLDYPNYEVIVVDDGSIDDTSEIASRYDVRLIRIPNGGLSNARNVGLREAIGELISYIDDDAYPDIHWLRYVAHSFLTTRHAGIGGPNIPPPEDGPIGQCVANSPGGPIHVLLNDTEAEHIPGCNMSFRRETLRKIGGFDIQFRTAGDDVDVCWRLVEHGETIGFSPSAVVWHHRRNSVKAYLRQQAGYGRAEALLEKKWPKKYNALGHVSWSGRLYGRGLLHSMFGSRSLIYQGRWGTAPFQSIYQPATGALDELLLTPEWYLLTFALGVFSILGFVWKSFEIFWPLLMFAVIPLFAQAIRGAAKAKFPSELPVERRALLTMLTTFLYFSQPIARLWGRLKHGLTPWRRRGVPEMAFPRPRLVTIWSERWRSSGMWLKELETLLQSRGAIVLHGSEFDSWDLEVRGGMLGAVRARVGIEEHGFGRQLVRFRAWPSLSIHGLVCLSFLSAISVYVMRYESRPGVVTAGLTILLAIWMFRECAAAKASVLNALEELRQKLS